MNNDIIVRKNWLKYLLETIENNKDAGYVGGKYLQSNGLVYEAGCFMTSDGQAGFCNYNEVLPASKSNLVKEVDYCSACGVILRKETWKKVGGFDERYIPGYYEDADLCFKIKHNLGLKILCQPKCEMYHFHGQTFGAKTSHHSIKNRKKFVEKWEHILQKQDAVAV